MDHVLGTACRYAPDGLEGETLNEVIARAYAEAAKAPGPTSALLDGSAAEQRRRRMERRAVATDYGLPMSRGGVGLDERQAA
jgi:hypothetical protein